MFFIDKAAACLGDGFILPPIRTRQFHIHQIRIPMTFYLGRQGKLVWDIGSVTIPRVERR